MSRKRAATRSRLKPRIADDEVSEASSSESLKSIKTEQEDRIDLSDFMLQSPTKARAPQIVTLKVRSRGLILVSFRYKQEICDALKEFEIDGKRACFWHTQEKRWSYASTTHVDVCAHGNMLCNWSRNHYGYSDTTELKLAAAPDVFLARMYSFLNACPHVEDIVIEDINNRTVLHSDMGSLTFPGFHDIQLREPKIWCTNPNSVLQPEKSRLVQLPVEPRSETVEQNSLFCGKTEIFSVLKRKLLCIETVKFLFPNSFYPV